MEWSAFDWLHDDCFPHLIQLAFLLPQKEDSLRNRITKVLEHLLEYICKLLGLFGTPFSEVREFIKLCFVCSSYWKFLDILGKLI